LKRTQSEIPSVFFLRTFFTFPGILSPLVAFLQDSHWHFDIQTYQFMLKQNLSDFILAYSITLLVDLFILDVSRLLKHNTLFKIKAVRLHYQDGYWVIQGRSQETNPYLCSPSSTTSMWLQCHLFGFLWSNLLLLSSLWKIHCVNLNDVRYNMETAVQKML
jgi:hypothetical protein